jgi:hypothetical protein
MKHVCFLILLTACQPSLIRVNLPKQTVQSKPISPSALLESRQPKDAPAVDEDAVRSAKLKELFNAIKQNETHY